jgi:hypothetical protein
VFLIALAVGELADNGEKMRFSLITHIADVWYLVGHTTRRDTVDVWP